MAATTEVIEDVDGGAPEGVLSVGLAAATTVLLLLLESISSMAGPLGGNTSPVNDHLLML
jgi:hypothetical protein